MVKTETEGIEKVEWDYMIAERNHKMRLKLFLCLSQLPWIPSELCQFQVLLYKRMTLGGELK